METGRNNDTGTQRPSVKHINIQLMRFSRRCADSAVCREGLLWERHKYELDLKHDNIWFTSALYCWRMFETPMKQLSHLIKWSDVFHWDIPIENDIIANYHCNIFLRLCLYGLLLKGTYFICHVWLCYTINLNIPEISGEAIYKSNSDCMLTSLQPKHPF